MIAVFTGKCFTFLGKISERAFTTSLTNIGFSFIASVQLYCIVQHEVEFDYGSFIFSQFTNLFASGQTLDPAETTKDKQIRQLNYKLFEKGQGWS